MHANARIRGHTENVKELPTDEPGRTIPDFNTEDTETTEKT